jgi:hypothetical protein
MKYLQTAQIGLTAEDLGRKMLELAMARLRCAFGMNTPQTSRFTNLETFLLPTHRTKRNRG